jgi:hypothetical protein
MGGKRVRVDLYSFVRRVKAARNAPFVGRRVFRYRGVT